MSDYSSNFPQQRPKLNLVFNSGSGKLDSRLSYSRSSGGTYLSNERHLSSENLVPYSNLNSGFSFGRTTLASTNNSAPDGGSDAASILETAVSGSHEVYDTFASVSGQQYSFVFYLKANGRTKVIFKPQATSVIANVTFDLTAVTSAVTSGSADSHSITAIGSTSGWYKCAVTVTATATGTGYTQFNLVDGTGASTYTGDVTKGMYAWGAAVSSTGQTVLNETSGSIHREFAPTLKTAAADEPRFEFDASGNSEGLLIEAQATSLITYSEDFSNSFWDKTRLSVDSNVAVAPDGTLTASAMRVDGTAASTHRMRFTYATGGATAQTFSIFAKAGSKSWVALKFDSSGGAFDASVAYFNLSSGTTGTVDSGITAKISACGNGWYRCSITRTALASATGQIELYVAEADNDVTIDGNSYDYILAWGAMVEANTSAPSSYIKSNSGSSTTKSTDSCSVVDATLFSSGEHTIIWEGDTDKCGDDPNIDKRFFSLSDTTTSNRLTVDYNDGTQVRLRNWADSNNDVAITYNADLTGGTHKVAATLKTNEVQLVIDGTRRQVDTSCVVGTGIKRLGVNTAFADAYQQYTMNGHCKRITYFNVALSQTEVEALTANP